MNRGRLRGEDEKRIQNNYVYLLDNLEPGDGLNDYMLSKGVFSQDDVDEIDNTEPKIRKTRAQVFIKVLKGRGAGAYKVFIDSLRENSCEHIADQLNISQDEHPVREPVDWFARLTLEQKGRPVTEKDLNSLASGIGKNWQLLMLDLGLSQAVIDQQQQANPFSTNLQVFTCLNKWRQKNGPKAIASTLVEALTTLDNVVHIEWDTVKRVFS